MDFGVLLVLGFGFEVFFALAGFGFFGFAVGGAGGTFFDFVGGIFGMSRLRQ